MESLSPRSPKLPWTSFLGMLQRSFKVVQMWALVILPSDSCFGSFKEADSIFIYLGAFSPLFFNVRHLCCEYATSSVAGLANCSPQSSFFCKYVLLEQPHLLISMSFMAAVG